MRQQSGFKFMFQNQKFGVVYRWTAVFIFMVLSALTGAVAAFFVFNKSINYLKSLSDEDAKKLLLETDEISNKEYFHLILNKSNIKSKLLIYKNGCI